MQIKWSHESVNDLESIKAYTEKDKPRVSKKMALRIFDSIETLANEPGLGRVGRIYGTRELVISNSPNIVPYRAKNNCIEIIRILHGSIKWPKTLKKLKNK